MAIDLDLKSMHLHYLRNRCAEESNRFFHRQDHDPRFCYEIFRRALADRDEAAWEYVYQQYQPLVAGWVERHSYFQALGEDKEYFVNWAFEKLWIVITPGKFDHFPDLKSILHYLQMCVHSVLTDSMRARERAVLIEDEAEAPENQAEPSKISLEDQVFRQALAEKLWAILQNKCLDERERLVAYASFVLGLKPAEIHEEYYGRFQDVKEVYRIKENYLARLKRDQEFIDFLGEM